MWSLGKFVLSAITVALTVASAEVHAQSEIERSLLFDGVSEPWQFLLKLGVCTGLFASLTPLARTLLDIATATMITPAQPQGSGGLNKSIVLVTCLAGGLFSYVIVSAVANVHEFGSVDVGEIWHAVVWGSILSASALSLFGLYRIRLPQSLQIRHQPHRFRSRTESLLISFVIGLLPTLAAVAVLVMIFAPGSIADSPALLFGSVFAFALLWNLALVKSVSDISPSLPLNSARFGYWSIRGRQFLGILHIAAVVHILGRFPEMPVLLLWGMLFMVAAVYLGATQKTSRTSKPSLLLSKGAGIAVMSWGAVCLVGASAGNRDITNPLPQLATIISGGGLVTAEDKSTPYAEVFTYVKTADQFERLLVSAKTAGRAVLLDFYADWCLDCKRMDRSTFRDPAVVARLSENFVALKVDVTDPDDAFGRDTKKRFGVFGPPALVMFDGQGNQVRELLTYGYLDTAEMLQLLSRVAIRTTSES